MKTINPPANYRLQLRLSPVTCLEFLDATADVIRALPRVQSVHVDSDRRELEVLCGQSASDLLQEVHQALVLVRTECPLGRAA